MFRHLLLIGMLTLVSAKSMAQEKGCCDCPDCGHKVCIAKPTTTKVSKTVYSVEKKDVCIPRFRFPWQIKSGCNGSNCDASCDSQGGECGCAPRCGRVRTVKVLKKKKIECEKCGYKWEITTVESTPCCDSLTSRRGKACCDSSCDSAGKK